MKKNVLVAAVVALVFGLAMLAQAGNIASLPVRVSGSGALKVWSAGNPQQITGIWLTSLTGGSSACGTLVDGADTVTGTIIGDICYSGNTPNAYVELSAMAVSKALFINFAGQTVSITATVLRSQAPNVTAGQ